MNLKSVIAFLCIFAFVPQVKAISAEDYHRLVGEIAPLDSIAQVRVSENDYAGAMETYLQMLVMVLCADDELVKALRDVVSNCYYNLACYQALSGQKYAALNSLYNAYEYGYNDYKYVMADTDLDGLRDMEYFDSILAKIKSRDFGEVLADAAPYVADGRCPVFRYADASDPHLRELRERLCLDSVAGSCDELSQIKNITRFVHNYIRHDGSKPNPAPLNGLALIESCGDGKGTLNCRGMALLLNECMLAMGIKSRYITCMPETYVNDCHVINAVYSRQLGRWVWMDPSFGAWVMDENGNLLGIREVRERLINGKPLALNEEADHYDNKTAKEWYLDYYMTKNLYVLEAQQDNIFGAEDNEYSPWSARVFVSLAPDGFTSSYMRGIVTNDDTAFWGSPE